MQDTITDSITIAAPIQRVWTLVSHPGWWLAADPDQVDDTPAPMAQRFPVETIDLQPPHRAVFRWASEFGGEPLQDGHCTIIEFTLHEANGMTTVTVVESGFASLAAPDETRRSAFEENTSGWVEELGYLKTRAERG